ncbi:MAG: hypothetical protein NVSMB33_14890 [Ktedonobacteraceae bacterium]
MSRYPERLPEAGLIILLIFILVACSSGGNGGSTSTPTTATGGVGSTATISPTAQVSLGPKPCPDAVKDPAHWDPIVGTQSGVSKVGRVTCANLVGQPTLQALILVGYQGTGNIVDVYVYSHITDPGPHQIFKLLGLAKGDAKISLYNTVITAEVDTNSSINKNQANAALITDLFREFKWSDGAGTLVPVSFPGIFPDLTRYQAEADQAEVNQGHQPWKLDAKLTAQALAANERLLKWYAGAPATIISGGGQNDVGAVVNVKSTYAGGGTITVTMSRLEGNSNGGIWEVTAVTTAGMSITAPQNRDRLTSPISVTGTGNAFAGKVGKVIVLDHLYTNIGQADANGAAGNGNTTFSTSVPYTSSFKTGIQEGLVVLYAYSNADGSISGAVMLKEMLS